MTYVVWVSGNGLQSVGRCLALTIVLLALAAESHAIDKFWDGGAAPAGLDGIFSVGANWNTILAPDATDVAHFGTSVGNFDQNSYTVRFTTNPTNQAMVVEDDNVTFDLDGHIYTTTATNPITLGVAQPFTFLAGQLTIKDGFVIAPFEALIKIGASRGGSLTVTTGGRLIGEPQIQLGDFANGTLTVDNNGDIIASNVSIGSNTGRTGTATITGGGSALLTTALNVGDGGTGTLDVSAGAQVDSSSGTIGRFSSSLGTVNVRDHLSNWDVSGLLIVGGEAPGTPGVVAGGTLNITAGGFVESGSGIVGDEAGSSGAVSVGGAGSTWDVSGNLSVGFLGSGTLNVTAGGRIESTTGRVSSPDGTAAVTVTGPGSLWISSNLHVAPGWTGTLDILDGGEVRDVNASVGAGGIGTVNVDGINSKWTHSGDFRVGYNIVTVFPAIGSLNITRGGLVENTGPNAAVEVGSSRGHGTVNVDGTGSRWIIASDLKVGTLSGDNNVVNVTRGGLLQSRAGFIANDSGSDRGTVNISDADSRWIAVGDVIVGNFGTGELNVTAGGRLESGGFVIVNNGTMNVSSGGQVQNVNGSINFNSSTTVAGANSQWTSTGRLDVGGGTLNISAGGRVLSEDVVVGLGDGRINITAGGRLDTGSALIDSFSTGSVNVSGAGAQWINSGPLTVGRSVTGTLNIINGGQVTNSEASVAFSSGATGEVTVASTVPGATSTWTVDGHLAIGGNPVTGSVGGTGTVRIQPGGTVNVTQSTHLWDGDNLFLEGGTFRTAAIITEGPIGFNRFFWSSGTLHVGVFEGNTLIVPNGGVLVPVRGFNSTTIKGDYAQQAGSTLAVEIAGIFQFTDYGVVTVEGSAFLGGNLQLSLIHGFVPIAANNFDIFQVVGALTGSFANVANGQRLATTDGLGSFIVNYGPGSPFLPNHVILSAFLPAGPLPGDYNQNGVVDAADYVVWRKNEGTTNPLTNDPIGGTIGTAQYNQWRAHFGETSGGGGGLSSNNVAPEPATLVLLIFAAARRCLRRGRTT